MSDIRTVHDYDMYEVLSAMQKCVRRNLEEDALYWATELQMSGAGMEGVLWGRILVMASEDVGLAADAALTCEALYRNWRRQVQKQKDGTLAAQLDEHGKPKDTCKLFALHAVLILVRAKKSRIADGAWCWLMAEEKLGRREHKPIPDFALDQHTPRGKRMGRGQLHFWTDGVQLENQELSDPYYERARDLMVEAERKGKS